MWAPVVMFAILSVMTLLPMAYSISFMHKEKAQGKEMKTWKQTADPRMQKLGMILGPAILVFCAVILFCGNITYDFQEDRVVVDSNFYSAYALRYDAIDDIAFREGNVPGVRVGGYGSLRLLMGWFENQEFGTYYRYTYYRPGAGVVVKAGNTTIVLSGEDAEETLALYEALLSKIEN